MDLDGASCRRFELAFFDSRVSSRSRSQHLPLIIQRTVFSKVDGTNEACSLSHADHLNPAIREICDTSDHRNN